MQPILSPPHGSLSEFNFIDLKIVARLLFGLLRLFRIFLGIGNHRLLSKANAGFHSPDSVPSSIEIVRGGGTVFTNPMKPLTLVAATGFD